MWPTHNTTDVFQKFLSAIIQQVANAGKYEVATDDIDEFEALQQIWTSPEWPVPMIIAISEHAPHAHQSM